MSLNLLTLPALTFFFINSDHDILSTLQAYATNKKSGFERESAAIAFQSLATVLGPSSAPFLLNSLPTLYDLYMDKGDVVQAAAAAAVKTILKLFPPESTRIVFRKLETILDAGKWKTKVGVLESMKLFVTPARDAVAQELGTTLPKVEKAMHDTKSEASHIYLQKIKITNNDLLGLISRSQNR